VQQQPAAQQSTATATTALTMVDSDMCRLLHSTAHRTHQNTTTTIAAYDM
jgi:hypothetical protein